MKSQFPFYLVTKIGEIKMQNKFNASHLHLTMTINVRDKEQGAYLVLKT